MARIFYRQYPRCSWDPGEPEAPLKGLTLREWETAVVLSAQERLIAEALRDWLEAPTDHQRWPEATSFPSVCAPFADAELAQPEAQPLAWLHDEIKSIRQTLDFPIEAFCGISRDVLLAMHGARLRALVRRLGLKRALSEIARYTRPKAEKYAA
ncbi:MAG TPA: hypothetical protein VFU69_06075 [Ktedonobacterales bacterium]|nr:hypothetical protein [Ktedonobacterales bacterium]